MNKWSRELGEAELTEDQAWTDFVSRPAHLSPARSRQGTGPDPLGDRRWGVAVTTFGMLGWLESQPGFPIRLDADGE